MENSMNSMSRSPAVFNAYDEDHHDHESPEESSWTMYFEDFSNGNNIDIIDDGNSLSFSSDINYQSASLISDAACSSAANRHAFRASNLRDKRLSFKKRKANKKGGLVEGDLEDTASSPVNSPKVCNLMNHFDKNLKQKEVMDISREKGSAAGDEIRNGDQLNLIGRENDGNNDQLKKKGLCLVPLSMVVHYLG